MQRRRLNDCLRSIEIRERIAKAVAKAVAKALFVLFVTCCVLAFWCSLVSCSSLTRQERDMQQVFDLLNQSEFETLKDIPVTVSHWWEWKGWMWRWSIFYEPDK